jgi:hypothetical protein
MLDGSGSFDPDGEPIALLWTAADIAFDNPMSSMPTARFPLGTTTVTLRATDGAGNMGTAMRDVVVRDTIAPATSVGISGTMGQNGWYRSAVDVALAATDACGLDGTYLALDGGAFVRSSGATLDDGQHLVEAYAMDVAGNEDRLQHRIVRVDRTAPSVAILDPMPSHAYLTQGPVRLRAEAEAIGSNSAIVVGGLTVRADAFDATSGVALVEFLVDGAVRGMATRGPFAFDGSADTPGTHTLAVRAVDAAGNSASAEEVIYLVPLPALA